MLAIGRARPPGHGHAIAGGDGGIGGIEVDLAASAGGKDDPVGANRFDPGRLFIQHVNAQTAVFAGKSQLSGGDQIHRHVVFQKIDLRLPIQFA